MVGLVSMTLQWDVTMFQTNKDEISDLKFWYQKWNYQQKEKAIMKLNTLLHTYMIHAFWSSFQWNLGLGMIQFSDIFHIQTVQRDFAYLTPIDVFEVNLDASIRLNGHWMLLYSDVRKLKKLGWQTSLTTYFYFILQKRKISPISSTIQLLSLICNFPSLFCTPQGVWNIVQRHIKNWHHLKTWIMNKKYQYLWSLFIFE